MSGAARIRARESCVLPVRSVGGCPNRHIVLTTSHSLLMRLPQPTFGMNLSV